MAQQVFAPSRREFLGSMSALALATGPAVAAKKADTSQEPIAFFVVGDTHYLANKRSPGELDEQSQQITTGLINTLNRLPGSEIPDQAGGGKVATPRGVIHAGDLIDSGDKNGRIYDRMQQTEWEAYTADFSVNGTDGRLRFPTYEVHGNHDSPHGAGVAIDGIKARNKHRPGLSGLSENGLHYSWDWGPVHFVNLGIVVGSVEAAEQHRRYAPLDSLAFLIADLKERVGNSGRPVVITHHIDVARYCVPCDETDPKNLHREWHPCDVRAYYHALKDYNVAAILYGHTHARNILHWDGQSARAEEGLSLFNVDNSAHFHSNNQAFFYFELSSGRLTVRECHTTDGWETSKWTPQVWRREVYRGPQ